MDKGGSITWLLDIDKSKFDTKLSTASSQAKGLASTFDNFNTNLQSAATSGAAAVNRWTKVLAVAGGAAAAFAIKSSADFEQSRIAFETMLGSGEAARTMLRNISDFARKTPFTLPEVVTGAKQLLAYGIAAQDILPDLKNLGNIAAGVGRDKLPFLTLAFGQVATKGHLAGQELRQFTEAGVPLVEQLAKTLGKTKEQITTMSEAGQIGFEDVRKALAGMSGEGGKFFNLMDRQSHSFSGVVSNIQDDVGRLARKVVGIDEEGNIRKNSIFQKLVDGATGLLTYLDANAEKITQALQNIADRAIAGGTKFVTAFVKTVKQEGFARAVNDALIAMLSHINWEEFTVKAILLLAAVVPQIIIGFTEGIFQAAVQHPLDFAKLFLLLGFLPGPILLALTTVLGGIPIVGPIISWVLRGMGEASAFLLSPIRNFFTSIGTAALTALDPVIATAAAKVTAFRALIASPVVMGGIVITAALASLALVFEAVMKVRGAINDVNNAARSAEALGSKQVDDQMRALQKLAASARAQGDSAAVRRYANAIAALSGGRAEGGPVVAGRSYLVGEMGPEIFTPNMSGQIIPNKQINEKNGVTINQYNEILSQVDLDQVTRDLAWRLQVR